MSANILVVDDEKVLLRSIKHSLLLESFSVDTASNPNEVFSKIKNKSYDVVVTDFSMPEMNGLELIQQVKRTALNLPAFVLMSGYGNLDMAIQAMRSEVSGFLKKPFTRDKLVFCIKNILVKKAQVNTRPLFVQGFRGGILSALKELFSVQESSYKNFEKVIEKLAEEIDKITLYTMGHSARVSRISLMLAKKLRIDEHGFQTLLIAALLHDMGNMVLPDEILNQTGKLNDIELNMIRMSQQVGVEILKSAPMTEKCIPLILHHHENWDGRGYPQKICGEEIPLGARIIGIAEAFDAMFSLRPHRKAYSESEAKANILKARESQFDPLCVDILLDSFDDFRDHLNPQTC